MKSIVILKTDLEGSIQLISWNLQHHTRSTSDFWKQVFGTGIHTIVNLSTGLGAKGGTRTGKTGTEITQCFGTRITQGVLVPE
jgi:hypothetical protein